MSKCYMWEGKPVNDYHDALENEVSFFLFATHTTHGELAKRLGVDANTLRMKRRGQTEYKTSELMKISEIIGKTPDQLLGLA